MEPTTDLYDELQRANRIEFAAERLRGRGMNHETVKAAAAELAKLDGAPVLLEELAELQSRSWVIRASAGHKIYRPATVRQFEALTGLLFSAGYSEAPYPNYSAYPMTNADGTRGRFDVVVVKPEAVTR